MESEFNSGVAEKCAEQLNALLLIMYENDSEGINRGNPLIGNALNLSAYIHNFFREIEINDQHSRT